jgi:hypothetical protein
MTFRLFKLWKFDSHFYLALLKAIFVNVLILVAAKFNPAIYAKHKCLSGCAERNAVLSPYD